MSDLLFLAFFFADDSELDSDLASDDDNEDSDDIDYFADVPSDNEEGEGGPTGAGGTKRAHYGDFFDAPEDEEKIINRPKVKQKDRQEKMMETAAVEEKEEERKEREEEGSHDSDGEEDSSDDGRELGELSGDEEIEGEGSTGESGAEEEEEREVEGGEDSEEENPKTLSSHERKQLKVSYATLSC